METSAELVGTKPLEWWLEDSQNAKFSWSPIKDLLVPTCTYGRLDSLVAKVWSLPNALLNVSRVLAVSRVLNSKFLSCKASKD
jgi:hypothetical protein